MPARSLYKPDKPNKPNKPNTNSAGGEPLIKGPIPGPESRALAERLSRVESRNVTCLEPEPPIFWARAEGAHVWDVDGNRFIDLTAAFGVANAGHRHPAVVEAVQRQAGQLLHGMGDVHPSAVKVELLEALVRLFPSGVPSDKGSVGDGERAEAAVAVLGSSGSDAVESALKTALLHTGRPGVLAFEGAYHGLALGVLDATWRADLREPFAARLPGATRFARFGDMEDVRRQGDAAEAERAPIGAVLVEPIQGRGGERVPPAGFLRDLRALCDERGWLLIVDEIYTGFGRTGRLFACEHEGVVPDLLCVGKGLASGLPISACLGRHEIMRAWPASRGEALHTQTFLGHPLGCAAGIASLHAIQAENLPARAAALGESALKRLRDALADVADVCEVRGLGLMIGIEFESGERAQSVCRTALQRGVIALPSGDRGQVLSLTPPLCIEDTTLSLALDILIAAAREGASVSQSESTRG